MKRLAIITAVAALVAWVLVVLVGFAIDLATEHHDDPTETNWYCGDPDDVAYGGQVIVVRCRQYESMLDGNDAGPHLAEMDIWLNRDGLINGIEGVFP